MRFEKWLQTFEVSRGAHFQCYLSKPDVVGVNQGLGHVFRAGVNGAGYFVVAPRTIFLPFETGDRFGCVRGDGFVLQGNRSR